MKMGSSLKQATNTYHQIDLAKQIHKSFATRDRNFRPGSQNKIPHVTGL